MNILVFLLTILLGITPSGSVGSGSELPFIEGPANRQLQTAQLDTQYRSDLGKIYTEAINYAANNNGQYPDTLQQLEADGYLDDADLIFELEDVSYDRKNGRSLSLSIELSGGETYTIDE